MTFRENVYSAFVDATKANVVMKSVILINNEIFTGHILRPTLGPSTVFVCEWRILLTKKIGEVSILTVFTGDESPATLL